MAEIEITLPTIQYGNIKIKATPEEWGLDTIADAPDVGVWAAIYLNLFQQGFKHGSTLDVDARLSASREAVVEKAQELLDKGLGGVTEVPAGDVVAHETPPWEKEAVAPKPKPWETGAQAAKPAPKVTADW